MIEQKIKRIIAKNIELQKLLNQDAWLNLELPDIGIDSIIFIKIIVAIEVEFDFEFNDKDLDFNKFPNIKSLVSYVQNKVS